MRKPRALVITGYGINCDYESAAACEMAGFEARRVHINDVLADGRGLFTHQLVFFPGGFSFGDDLGSGVAFASKLRYGTTGESERFGDLLLEYRERGGLILGVCNGFQILVRLGVVPAADGAYGVQEVTLAPNREGYFVNRWVSLAVDPASPCVFTRGVDRLRLPVRHGEGRFVSARPALLESIERDRLVVMRYCDAAGGPTLRFPGNPNGSEGGIAGICDPSGRVFGLMPHPEAAVSRFLYPDWTREGIGPRTGEEESRGEGFHIFKNACLYVK
jgi:phosphoribosylformylglycinamidine synthase I